MILKKCNYRIQSVVVYTYDRFIKVGWLNIFSCFYTSQIIPTHRFHKHLLLKMFNKSFHCKSGELNSSTFSVFILLN